MKEFKEVLTDIFTPEELARIPQTPEKKAEARKRLEAYSKSGKKCQICLDTKFVYPRKEDGTPDYTTTIPCVCARKEAEQKKKDNLLKYCELPEKGKEMTFDLFKRSRNTEEAYQACLAMAEERFHKTFLTLMGQSDHGKTHLLVAVCNYRLKQEKLAKYAHVPFLLDELRNGFKQDGDESYVNRFKLFLNVPLLALDDLGVENDTPWAQEHLDELIDYRLMHKLSTIVTSNLLFKELPFRIASRLKREGEIIPILGEAFHK